MAQQLDGARHACFEDANDGFGRATLERTHQRVRAEAGYQERVVVRQQGEQHGERIVCRQRRVFGRVDGGESCGVVGERRRCEVGILGFWLFWGVGRGKG